MGRDAHFKKSSVYSDQIRVVDGCAWCCGMGCGAWVQTLLDNSEWCGTVENDDVRYVDWSKKSDFQARSKGETRKEDHTRTIHGLYTDFTRTIRFVG